MDGSEARAAAEAVSSSITLTEVLTALAILAVAALIAFVSSMITLRRARAHDSPHISTWYTVSRLIAYTVIVVGVFLAITALGVSPTDYALLAGVLGVGLGFGLQALFANSISGVVLLLDKSLKVGDFVELESGVTGEVRDIKVRATTIVTNDNIDILVPNSEFVTGRVVNWTHRDVLRRMRVPFGVAYGTDKNLVKTAALVAAAAVPFTLHLDGPRRPQVWLMEFGSSSLNFELVIWLNPEATKKPVAVIAAYNWALHTALEEHGIEIPFPQNDLHVKTLFGLSDADARTALGLTDVAARPGVDAPGTPSTIDPQENDAIDDVGADTDPHASPEATAPVDK